MNSNTTRSNPTKKSSKIPEVKHFYDVDAAKKVKKLAKKAMNSNLVKHAKEMTSTSKDGSKGILAGAVAAPIALQVGTVAVIAGGGYALWKNREKIQTFLGGILKSESNSASEQV